MYILNNNWRNWYEQGPTKKTTLNKPCNIRISWRVAQACCFTNIRNPQRYPKKTGTKEETSASNIRLALQLLIEIPRIGTHMDKIENGTASIII